MPKELSELATSRIFTTGMVSRLVGVSPRTVSLWFDAGRIRGYRIPGSQDRRIPRDALIKFLADNGMPTIEDYAANQP